MGGLSLKTKGDWKDTFSFFTRAKKFKIDSVLTKYGQMGVDALKEATPKDTGVTAASWYFTVEKSKYGATISFCNSNAPSGVKVAVLLQYGHATRNGYWVEGIDYIYPALNPIFNNMAKEAWEEVTK